MSPITPEEAYARTNPEDPEEARTQAAQSIIAGVTANDAYLNSRNELEQIALRMAGGQHPPTFEELNAQDASQVEEGKAAPGSVEGSATELTAPPSQDAQEIAALEARLAELQAKQGGAA